MKKVEKKKKTTTKMKKKKTTKKKTKPRTLRAVSRIALLAGFALVLGVAVLEGGARVIELLGGQDVLRESSAVRHDHPLLEYTVEPGSGGHDARGYRNPEALERADIVTLGDSQTWGVNAEMEQTWPAALARRTGLSVYNMGRGGYGLLQYRVQLEEALSLEPRVIVVALYFGNDLFDAYDLAYKLEGHAKWRLPEEGARQKVADSAYPNLQQMFFDRINYRRGDSGPLAWISRQTAAGRMLASLSRSPADTRADRIWAEDHPHDGFVYDQDGLSTVFHVSYRFAAVDLGLARIREGLRISENVLIDIKARIDQVPGCQLLVVLLPTKERVFERAVMRADPRPRFPSSYIRSVRAEGVITRKLKRMMDEYGIEYVDTQVPLEASVLVRKSIFPPNVDGHFTPRGYDLVSASIAPSLARMLKR